MSGKLPAHPVKIVGGGPKKILYTLKTVSRIGLLDSAKALNSHNACKACGLGNAGAASITVANRTVSRAETLIAAIQPQVAACPLQTCSLPADLHHAAERADLIVNCTSLGMTPQVETMPWPDDLAFRPNQTVYDLVYNPPQTRLLQRAAHDGARAIGGLGMLIWQGAIAFQTWTGIEPPVEVMRAALADR